MIVASYELVTEEVLGHRMTVFRDRHRSLRSLLDASLDYGDRDYLVDGDRRISYADHHAAVGRVARWLAAQGVGKGDRVAILGPNCIEWVATFWATVSIGAIAVGLNAWWSPGELAAGIADCDPKLVVDDLGVITPLLEGAPAEIPDAAVGEDDPAVIVYTSGTTGRAKGATHSHRNVVCLVQAQQHLIASRVPPGVELPPSRILSTSPLFHVAGLHSGVIAALGAGATIVWQPGRFDPEQTLATIERERVTNWSAVPTMVWRVVHHPRLRDFDTSTLRHIGGGSAAWSPALQDKMREAFGDLTYGIGYGQTESTGLSTSASYADLLEHPETVGRPVATVEMKVVDGEICLRGPMVMLGYWRNDEATRRAIDGERWLHTGDLGEIRDGLLYLTTRRTDLIVRGGENVYPVEIENCLEAHSAVAEAAVVGLPDDELGAQVCAVVVPVGNAALDEADLAAHVKERLAYFKVPARWVVRSELLPRNAGGKLDRAAVIRELEGTHIER